MSTPLTADIISAAIEGLEARKRLINDQIVALREAIEPKRDAAAPQIELLDRPKRKRAMSAAGRQAISRAQKARWAARKTA